MNRPSFLVCLGEIAIASPHAASAQTGPKAISSGSASVEIVAQDLVLNEGLPLAFGLVKSRDLAGTVIVKPEGIREPGGAAEMVGSGPCQTVYCEDETNPSNPESASYWGPGVFTVTGAPNLAYRVVARDESAFAYWRTPATGREPQLLVTDFTFLTESGGGSTGVLDANGMDRIRVGGTLHVVEGMKTASYRVTVPITVQYY